MASFSIDILASQSGVTPANIRSWQRYGLIKPFVDDKGHRYFDFSHCARVADIVSWLEKGVSLSNMLALINGEEVCRTSGWFGIQEALLSCCESQQPQRLRSLIWRHGRELPASIFIDEVIRPLRLWMSATHRASMTMSRAVFDSALIEYSTFVMSSGRKRAGGSMMLIALSLKDPIDIWLEAIRFASDGFKVEVLATPITAPTLDDIVADHIMIWADKPFNMKQRAEYQRWLEEGKPVFLAGAVAKKTHGPAYPEPPVGLVSSDVTYQKFGD